MFTNDTEQRDILAAKKAVVVAFRNNFNYRDHIDNPLKETLDSDEVILTSYIRTDTGWTAKAQTIFDDGFSFGLKSENGSVAVTVTQTIVNVSYLESELIEGALDA